MSAKSVIDTSVLIAVIADEAHKPTVISATTDRELLAPGAVAWEIGNAFSAMFKRGRLDLDQARVALHIFQSIPVQWVEIDMEQALVPSVSDLCL